MWNIQFGVQIVIESVYLSQRNPVSPPQWQSDETDFIVAWYVKYEAQNVFEVQTAGVSAKTLTTWYVNDFAKAD